jgi:hypothetical protein
VGALKIANFYKPTNIEMSSHKYHATMSGVLAWANSELDHVGRIASIEDKSIQYAYAVSTVNGMMHLRNALYELVKDKNYEWKREEFLRTHDQVVRVIKHLMSEYKIDFKTIKRVNVSGLLKNTSYLRNKKTLKKSSK